MTGVHVEVSVGSGATADPTALEAAIRAVLARHEVTEGEVSLALLDDGAIHAMNRDHLAHDYPTDVLSFALWDEGEPVVGDVYIGWEQASRQAAEAGVPVGQELVRLAVHGTLHVLGYDHPDDAEERRTSEMYRLQEELVSELTSD